MKLLSGIAQHQKAVMPDILGLPQKQRIQLTGTRLHEAASPIAKGVLQAFEELIMTPC